jgi:signal transduction histidine kinase
MSMPSLAVEDRTPQGEGLVRAETMLLLSGLMGGVLHEINNPLAALLGQAHLLRERPTPGPDRVGLDRLSRAADRLARLGKSFNLMAREAGQESLLFSVNAEIEQTLPFFAHACVKHRVVLESEFAVPSPVLKGSPRPLRLLVVALLSPALEALDGKGGRLRLSTTRPGQGRLVIEVASSEPAFDVCLEPRILALEGESVRPSVYLAACLSRELGGDLQVHPDRLRASLPVFSPRA